MKKRLISLAALSLLLAGSITSSKAQTGGNTLIVRDDENALDLNEVYQSAAESTEFFDSSYYNPVDENVEPDVAYSDLPGYTDFDEEYPTEQDIAYEDGEFWSEEIPEYLETEDFETDDEWGMIVRDDEEAVEIIEETPEAIPDGPINPLTGTPVRDPALLTYPPFLVPLASSPSLLRPNAGATSAAWVFELYAGYDESRPILLFFGEVPEPNEELFDGRQGVFPVSSSIFGVESLRRLYRGVVISAPLSASVKNQQNYNIEFWYGLPQDPNEPLIPYHPLPMENFHSIMEKWQSKSVPPDINNLGYSFKNEAPEGGKPVNSLFIRYALTNRIIWQYDVVEGNFKRSQNSVEDPITFTADIDRNNNKQVAVENLIILFVPHTPIDGGYFDLDLTYTDDCKALVFRDGKMYDAKWTTISENFEVESNRLRPIRILDENGNNFPLKPGKTWVHIVQPGNPYYEVNETMGQELKEGTGFWKLPYLAFSTRRPIGDWDDISEYFEIEETMLNKTENK